MEYQKRDGNHLAMTRQNFQVSPLLRLPAELRLQIYTYVVAFPNRTQPKRAYPTYHATKADVKREHAIASRTEISDFAAGYSGLLLTCRQTWTEARLLPFWTTTLDLRVDDLEERKAYMTEDQKSAIRSLRLTVLVKEPWPTLPSKSSSPILNLRAADEQVSISRALSGLTSLKKISLEVLCRQCCWLTSLKDMSRELELARDLGTLQIREALGNGGEVIILLGEDFKGRM